MNNILAFDCSSNDLALYLKKGNQEYINVRKIGLKHSEKLLPLIDSLMNEAQLTPQELDLIACSKGPGSFTGLRIAMATAKGIANATGTPIVSVLTPDYLVAAMPTDVISVVLIDAKKRRYYGRIYMNNEPLTAPLDIAPADLAKTLHALAQKYQKPVVVTGPDAPQGLDELKEAMEEGNLTFDLRLDPMYGATRIDALAKLALEQYKEKGPDSETTGPLYIRRSEAEEAMNLEISTHENSTVIYQN